MPLIFCLVDILTQFRPLFQPSKLRPVLYLHCRSHHAPPSCDVDRHLSSGSPKGRLRFIGEVPFPWQMGQRCGCSTSD